MVLLVMYWLWSSGERKSILDLVSQLGGPLFCVFCHSVLFSFLQSFPFY